jgi:glycopeptide antibiotics resistance protein
MKKINLSTLLWICYSIFIVYATTIPFNVIKSNAELHHNINVISWKPFYNTDAHGYFSRGDLITNVLFFIPFGFFGLYSMRRIQWPKAWVVLFLSLLGTALSAFVEFLQMFTVDRNTSDTDLITNTLGTIVGMLCAVLLRPSLGREIYKKHFARFTHAKAAFPLLGILLVTMAGALAPFDFGINRGLVLHKLQMCLPWGSHWELGKQDLVVFLYYGALISFISALCFKQWRLHNPLRTTILFGLATAVIIVGSQPFIFTLFPSGGSLIGIILGIFAGLTMEWFTSRHYRVSIAWVLAAVITAFLLFFNFSPPVQSASKLGSFLRFSSRGSESMKGLMNFIEITAQFIPVGFIVAYLCSSVSKRTAFIVSIIFPLLLAAPLLLLRHWGLPSLYDYAVLIIAEIAALIGSAACLWAWPVFNYFCRKYEDE